MQNNMKIDFVIPWVDGSDPVWQADMKNHLPAESGIDAGESRYRDWDNLRYWFRAVEKYAPWVNKIFFITCGQTPAWLNTQAEKLVLVDHRDYIPEAYLPTFSSHPIELNLHRIPELSEHFVYFNDDFFLTAPVKPGDYFRNGLPCDCLMEGPMEFPRIELYNSIMTNNVAFANMHFDRRRCRREYPGKWYPLCVPKAAAKNALTGLLGNRHFFGIRAFHLPQPFLKSSFGTVWEMEPELLDRTCSHRFRSMWDISQHSVKFYQLLTGKFSPCDMTKMGRGFRLGSDLDAACSAIRSGKYRQICLNDADVADFEAGKQALNAAFAQVLPEKSSFELD